MAVSSGIAARLARAALCVAALVALPFAAAVAGPEAVVVPDAQRCVSAATHDGSTGEDDAGYPAAPSGRDGSRRDACGRHRDAPTGHRAPVPRASAVVPARPSVPERAPLPAGPPPATVLRC